MTPATSWLSIGTRLRRRVLEVASRYVPHTLGGVEVGPDEARRLRTGIVIAWFGVLCTTSTALLYAALGSPWSALAILAITPGLLFVHVAVRRGISLRYIGNAVTLLTWLVTFVVGARTGGFASPALVWAFFHPITTYVACGMRSAVAWCGLSALQVLMFYLADRWGFPITQDLSGNTPEALRVSGFIACILTNSGLMSAIEEVRAASQEALDRANLSLERQRLLADMHDGIGAQLAGLILQVRADRIGRDGMLQGLEASLDDLRLIVSNLDPCPHSFETNVGELRARIEPRCAAAGVDLDWRTEPPAAAISPEATLQVLRALQEITTNALRHAQSSRIEVILENVKESGPTSGWYDVRVRDFGIGFDQTRTNGRGRGLKNLEARARKVGGKLTVESGLPGTRVSLRFPCKPAERLA